MTREGAADPIGFGSGISTDHKDGIRWVDYTNISWNPVFCKRCDICVDICPKDTLVLRNDAIIEQNCISAASAIWYCRTSRSRCCELSRTYQSPAEDT
jgi:ferredoxin